MCAVTSLLLSLCCGSARAQPEAYYADGYHGGYFLAGKHANRQALEDLFATLDRYPDYVANLEFEPCTLERMLHGTKYACEMPPDIEAVPAVWVTGHSQCEGGSEYGPAEEHGHVMRLWMREGGGPAAYVNCCQTVEAERWRGKKLVFSGLIQATTTGAHLYIDAHAGDPVVGESAHAPLETADGEWYRVECTFEVDRGAVTLYPQAKIGGQECEAWFDELSLRDQESGTELLRNGDFEQAEDPDLRMPDMLERLREYVAEGRIEMVGGTYTQPLCYPLEGESLVRQFVIGLEATREALGVDVVTYAAQEPCFASQLPQVLNSLGFAGCIFRNSWAPFGNPPQRDAQKVIWEGPDGSRIEAVPRYAVDPMIGFGFPGFPSRDNIDRATAAGIAIPMWHQFADFLPEWTPAFDPEAFAPGRAFAWANFCRMLDAQDLVGQTLVLSCQAKAELPGAHLYIDAHGERGYLGVSARSPDVVPDGTWQRLEVSFTVPEGALRIFPQAKLEGAESAALFADVRLVGADGAVLADSGAAEEAEAWGAASSPGAQIGFERLVAGGPDGGPCVRLAVAGARQNIAYTTLGGYLAATPAAQEVWPDPYTEFQQRYPWGILGGEVQRSCRAAEQSTELAERIAAIARLDASETLGDAWRLTLMGQHHDSWVCAPVKFGVWRGPQKSYAELCAAWGRQAEELAQEVLAGAAERPVEDGPGVTVVNPSGQERTGVVTLDLPDDALPDGAEGCELRGTDGTAFPGEVVAEPHGRKVRAGVTLPPTCARSFNLAPAAAPAAVVRVDKTLDGPELENEFVSVRCGPAGLQSLSDKRVAAMWRWEQGETAGHFAGQQGQTRSEGRVEEVRAGALSAAVRLTGTIGAVPLTQTVTLDASSPVVTVQLSFDFGDGVDIGSETQEVFPDTSERRCWVEELEKLRFCVPLGEEGPVALWSDHPYDVRPAPRNPYFGISWVAAIGPTQRIGVLFDRTSAFALDNGSNELTVTLGYGGYFMYAPQAHSSLAGRHTYRLGIVPLGQDWLRDITDAAEEFALPLVAWLGKLETERPSLIEVGPEAELTACYYKDGRATARLFRPYGGEAEVTIRTRGGAGPANLAGVVGATGRSPLRGGAGKACPEPSRRDRPDA